MSRLHRFAAAVIAALGCAAAPPLLAPAAAQQLETPPPLLPLASPPLAPPLQPPPAATALPPGAPVLQPLSAPRPLLALRQTHELQAPKGGGPPEPQPGQAGKDVIWLPTPESLVERMLTMAQVTPADVVYDLGSGDGRLVIAAAKRGARKAVGVEIDPALVREARENARAARVEDGVTFVQGDLFQVDFSDATVVTLYLYRDLNLLLRPKLLALRPGTRIVSHRFDMGDWKPAATRHVEGRTIYLWIVGSPPLSPP
jgi:hypothetical protein